MTRATDLGNLPLTNQVYLAIGLPLRNQAGLTNLIHQIYNPRSPLYHHYLTPAEFTARFGPTVADYQAVIHFVRSHGLTVTHTHPNRVVLDVAGCVSNVQSSFQVTLHRYHDARHDRDFYAPTGVASVPTNLPVADVWGLSDYSRPIPLANPEPAAQMTPQNYNGSGPGGSYQGRDFRRAYAPGTKLSGAGQVGAVAEFDGYYSNDIASYEANCGYASVPLTNILLDGVTGAPGYSGAANAVAEVSLDIELLIAMAPNLSQMMIYEGSNPYDVLNQIATDDTAKQISCSWTWSTSPNTTWSHGHHSNSTLDAVLQQMTVQGQSFFQASGDSDAYTGGQALSTSSGPIPVDSIYVTSVGGTSLSMTGTGSSAAWSAETVWNQGNNTGSGGGISPNYAIPSWQAGVNMSANGGSTANRNIPDVALTADAIHVVYNNGQSGTFGGTSCAAPLWAGFTALVNQQAAEEGRGAVGFLNPALYSIAAGTNYTACFHDITTGNNIGTNGINLYQAVPGYDLATGLGTPNGVNLINALAPPTFPLFTRQPTSQTVTNGDTVTFSAVADGQAPLNYQWQFGDTNLPAGGNVSGATSSTLTLASVTSANAGNYRVMVNNSYGSVTSSVAVLTVETSPIFLLQPLSQTNFAGTNVSFSVNATANTPVAYQWYFNQSAIASATNSTLTLSNLNRTLAGNYDAVATAAGGSSTSAVVTLTVQLLASRLTLNSASNPAGYLDPLTFWGTVSPTNAAGTMAFFTNGAAFDQQPLLAGTASVTNVPSLPRGTNLIMAVYSGDAFYQPATNWLAQVITNHPPAVKPAYYTRPAGSNLVIVVANLATNWSDADKDALSITAISPSTNGVIVTNALPDLFYANTNNVNDRFVCTISDGHGGTNFQTVNISIVAPPDATPLASSLTTQPNGTVTLSLGGAAGSTYILECRTNLMSGVWVPIATNTLDATGKWTFTDQTATNHLERFYRLELAP